MAQKSIQVDAHRGTTNNMVIIRHLRDYVRVGVGVDKQRVMLILGIAAADDDGRCGQRVDGGGNMLTGR